MSAAKTASQRKAEERARMRSEGFVLKQIWVDPRDWPRVEAMVDTRIRFRRQIMARKKRSRPSAGEQNDHNR